MTAAPLATSAPEAETRHSNAHELVTAAVNEALTGKENSGLVEQIVVHGVTLELQASFGWGVRIVRTIDGEPVSKFLSGAELTDVHVAAACEQLARVS